MSIKKAIIILLALATAVIIFFAVLISENNKIKNINNLNPTASSPGIKIEEKVAPNEQEQGAGEVEIKTEEIKSASTTEREEWLANREERIKEANTLMLEIIKRKEQK